MKISANLGFLWQELALCDAIEAAARHGFDAVECHFPYDVDPASVRAALSRTGLPMVGLNTVRGDPGRGDNGLAAVPGRVSEARAAIDQAIDYGAAIGAANVHVMAGIASGNEARDTFVDNLRYAAACAEAADLGIVIEPLNTGDAPGYFLNNADDAVAIIEAVASARVRLMFDCYHLQIMQGDLPRVFDRVQHAIGHVQFAAVPSRAEPDTGEVNYPPLLRSFADKGYDGAFGAEYKPRAGTEAGLGWLRTFRNAWGG